MGASCHYIHACRHLEISGESHKLIDAMVQESSLDLVSEPFQLGKSEYSLPNAFQ